MKRIGKAVLTAALLLAVLPLFGCGRNRDVPKRQREGVCSGTPLILPEGERPLDSVLPRTDGETGGILCAAGQETGAGTEARSEIRIYACTADGKEAKPLRSCSVDGTVLCGAVTADGAVFVTTTERAGGNREYALVRTAGEEDVSADLADILPESVSRDFYGAAADEAGNLYLLTGNEAIVLAPDLTRRLILDVPRGERLVRDGGGSVWVMYFEKTAYKLARIDPDAGVFAGTVSLPPETRGVWFGRDADWYYEAASGIFRHKEGEPDGTVLHFVNSGLSSTHARVLAVPDPEHVLLIRHRPDIGADVLTMYEKAGDEELERTVLEIACASRISALYSEKIILFNESHDDLLVSVTDYSVYNTEEDSDAGNRRLSLDILTGAYSPDLIVGQYGSDASVNMVVEKGLYADLTPYLREDPEVNMNTVFPCLLRSYDDGRGGIWGMTDRFSLAMLAGSRRTLGKAAEAGKWTVREMLDFYDSLPEGCELVWFLSRSNAAQIFLGWDGAGAFIDAEAGTCSFESEDFLRFLRLLPTLPADFEEYGRRSPYADVPEAERYRLYQEGKIALQRIRSFAHVYSYLQLGLYFPDGDAVVIGYPTAGDSGNRILTETSWIITSFGADRDASWQLLRVLLRADENTPTRWPALIPDFDEFVSEEMNTEFFLYYSGITEGRLYDPEHPASESDLRSPGIVAHYTEEDHEALKALISEQGTPLISRVPEEVQDIIDEEISAYLGGVGTAENCAKKIQSRVSIWLAEHR